LISEGLVQELEAMESNNIGRPGIALSLKPEGGAVVGLEIGVGFISVILTDFIANILWRERVCFSLMITQQEILAQTEALIDQAIKVAQDNNIRMLGIGIGVPGLVDVQKGELLFAPNLGWRNVPLKQMLDKKFDLPIYLENEANLGALGEYYFGVGRNVDNFIYLSSDVGLGGGVIINGKLFKGARGLAGEIGHIQRDPDGELCGCGRRGCWETQVGPRAVLQRVNRTMESISNENHKKIFNNSDSLTFNQVVDCAIEGDQVCLSALQEVGKNLGQGIADLANIFNPEMVVIGGAFAYGRKILLSIINEIVIEESLPSINQTITVAFSDHGADACVLGAVAIVLDDIVREVSLI
jgi:glucokinase-like ROK family protein